MRVVGDVIVHLGAKGAASELEGATEQREYGRDARVVAGEGVLARRMPDDVIGEQAPDRGHVALAEGRVPSRKSVALG